MFAVRQKLGEMRPNFWSDTEIVEELNISAQRMCSEAQYLSSFGTFNTKQDKNGEWAQEYALPLDVDQITGAGYFSGTLFPLKPLSDNTKVQIGGYCGGIPFYFYIKKNTKVLTPQVSGGEIESQPMNPNTAQDARCVIGLWPIPQSALPIYIWYLQWHPVMRNPLDECQIPARFKQGWVAYAVARMKEKESAREEADAYDAQHAKYTQEFVEYCVTNGQEISAPQYGPGVGSSVMLRGASTVLVVAQNPGTTNL